MSASRLDRLAWPEVPTGVLAVPVGATEQHGPHLPVTTDTNIAEAIVNGLSDRRPDVVVAPAVSYGSSGEHAGFAGTLSIGREATELLLVELGRSGADSFGRTLLVSTHGGNADPVNRAVSRLRAEGRDVRAWAPQWEGDAHAGRVETSVMLAVAPDGVALDRAAPGNTRPLAELLPILSTDGTRAVSDNGVLGDPTGASADEGRRLLGAAIDDLEAIVTDWMQVFTSTHHR
jgi:mycofactocin system creatininase family protein